MTTVVDAYNSEERVRRWLVDLALSSGTPAIAFVLDVSLEVCLRSQDSRSGPADGRRWGRAVPAFVVAGQHAEAGRSLATLAREGFATVFAVE